MREKTKEIYLTEELKKYYLNDYTENVLTESDPAWKLDSRVDQYLTKINKNPFIQTLFAQYIPGMEGTSKKEGYLWFCYAESVKEIVLTKSIPALKHQFELKTRELNKKNIPNIEYNEEFPRRREKEEIYPESKLGCRNNIDYFYINHIVIKLESRDSETHTIFWELLSEILCRVNFVSDQRIV